MNDIYFGWRISQFGPPTCWRGDLILPTSTHSKDEPYYPITQWRKLAGGERELSLDALQQLYPFVKPKEAT